MELVNNILLFFIENIIINGLWVFANIKYNLSIYFLSCKKNKFSQLSLTKTWD